MPLAWMDTQYLVPFIPFSEPGPAPRIAPEGPLPHTRAPIGASALPPRSPEQHFPNVGLACRSTLDAAVPPDKNDVGTRAGRRRRSCSGHLFSYRVPRYAATEILLTNLVDTQSFSSSTLCSAHSQKRRAHTPLWGASTREVFLQTPRPGHEGPSTESEGPRSCEEIGPGTVGRVGLLNSWMPTRK